MPYLETKSKTRWHYYVQGSGPCLVLIHGWASSAKVFIQQAEHFSRDYQVVSLDLPGHGFSEWQPLTMQEMAEDILFLVEQLGYSEAVIVGSSLGGMIGLECVRLNSSIIKKLVMVGSLPRFLKTQERPLGLSLTEIQRLKKQLKSRYPEILDIFFRSLFTIKERDSQKFKWIHQFRKSEKIPDQQALEHFLTLLLEIDLTNFLLEVHIPVLFVSGDNDYICPPESINFIKQIMPQAQYKIIENSGHFPFIIYAKEFNEAVEMFLKQGRKSEE